MKTQPNDPASPFHFKQVPSVVRAEQLSQCDFPGFSKRERMALLLHVQFVRAAAFNQEAEAMLIKAGIKPCDTSDFIASLAVAAADSLIAALNE